MSTLRTGLPISLGIHGVILAGLVFLFPAAALENDEDEAVAVEILDEIVVEKQEAAAEDNVEEPDVTSIHVESAAPEVKTAATSEVEVAMDMSSKVEIALNQPETQSITTEASLSLDMTPDIAIDAEAKESEEVPVAEADVTLDMTPDIKIEADAPQPQAKPTEASLALDMTPDIAIETHAPAMKMASVESQVMLDMTPNIAMEPVQSDAAPAPLAEASIMMSINSEVQIAAIDQAAQTAPAAEASLSMSIAPPPAAKKQPPPEKQEKKKAEKKAKKKPARKEVAEENFAAKTGKTQKSAAKEKAEKIAAERKRANTKKNAGKVVSGARDERKSAGLGGKGNTNKSSQGDNARYKSMVRARLVASFRNGGGRGRVMIAFTLHPDGRMSGGRISRSSGNGAVDAAALSALRRTSFPAFLPGMPRSPKAFLIPMAIQ